MVRLIQKYRTKPQACRGTDRVTTLPFSVAHESFADRYEQVVVVEWLHEIGDDSRFQRARPHPIVWIGSDENHRNVLTGRDEVTMQVEPRHSGHLHIRNHGGSVRR